MPPYFSIIIPMYNRERFIARTINCCLKQDFDDFEIIVVDDGSTDRSVSVVEEIKDPRIKLIRHETNQERLIARNTGARASKGQWLIWFDSDDELVSDALALIKRRIGELPSDVQGLRFMCRLDSGHISPDPPYCDETWNYERYLRWVESHQGRWSETMVVVNQQTIQFVLFPEDKFYTGEMQYHLDIASKYKMKACVDILRLYHFDADNTSWKPDLDRILRAAPAFAARLESIF
jgi:glycosyltransferase involved in cell wall biosynthesis